MFRRAGGRAAGTCAGRARPRERCAERWPPHRPSNAHTRSGPCAAGTQISGSGFTMGAGEEPADQSSMPQGALGGPRTVPRSCRESRATEPPLRRHGKAGPADRRAETPVSTTRWDPRLGARRGRPDRTVLDPIRRTDRGDSPTRIARLPPCVTRLLAGACLGQERRRSPRWPARNREYRSVSDRIGDSPGTSRGNPKT